MIELLSQFHFLRPQWLWLLVPAVLCVWLLRSSAARDGDWARAIAPELLQHLITGQVLRRSRYGIFGLLLLWCLGAIATAGPSWEQLPRPVLQKQDALVVVMDLSYSMLANDLEPSRADRMRRKLLDLLQQREEGLSALIAYAGDAHVVAPLTDDHRTIANLLPALDPTMMPLPGSNPVDAVRQAIELLTSAGVRSGRLLLVTDGVSSDDGTTIAALLDGSSHRLAILGIGTSVGAPIPLPQGGFLKNATGSIVVPALEEEPLRSLASATGGSYRRMRVDDTDLTQLLAGTRSLLDDETIARDRETDEWQDMAHWFALPLLAVCLLSFRRGWIYGLALCALMPVEQARANVWDSLWLRDDQRAARALSEGRTDDAASLFDNPAWRGTAAWQAGDYEQALEAFSKGSGADDWFNRGNTLAAQGRLDEAIAAYEESLELQPDSEDAKRNLEVLRNLKEQQEQQEQEEQQESQDGQSQQDQEPSESDSAESEGSEGSPPEDGASDQENPDEQNPPEEQGNEQQDASADDANESGEQQDEQKQPLTPSIDNSAMQESLERDQALEQWLRRVPDDPSGLLREKFRYESRQRQKQGETRENEQVW